MRQGRFSFSLPSPCWTWADVALAVCSPLATGPISPAERPKRPPGSTSKRRGLKLLLLHSQQPSAAVETQGYGGRKLRAQLDQVRAMLAQEAVGIAKETRLTIYCIIKDDPAGSEAALAAWGL
jgi:hypothetical protein